MARIKRDASNKDYAVDRRTGYRIGGKRTFLLLKVDDTTIETDFATLSKIYGIEHKNLSSRINANFNFAELIEPQKKLSPHRAKWANDKTTVTIISSINMPSLALINRLINSLPTRSQLMTSGDAV